MSKGKSESPLLEPVQAGAGGGPESDAGPSPAARAAMRAAFPLREFQAAELGLDFAPVRYGIRGLCAFTLPSGDILRAGYETSLADRDTAEHCVAYGLATAIGWTVAPETLRARATEALGQLVGGDPDATDRMTTQAREQIARVLALVEEK